ncbi:MAG TPA: hypothetical protein VMF05_10505 [Stellaceae bacterium]|nr:hypothetical protein [Stellaceae bacterium]
MAFLVDLHELKPGLVVFRRTDVQHRNWYCRVRLPNAERYKTISLKTPDLKNYIRDSQIPEGRLPLDKTRREERAARSA